MLREYQAVNLQSFWKKDLHYNGGKNEFKKCISLIKTLEINHVIKKYFKGVATTNKKYLFKINKYFLISINWFPEKLQKNSVYTAVRSWWSGNLVHFA